MIQEVAVGIAMGNALPGVKQVADYVTEPVDKEGIRKGLKYFQLI